MPDFKEEHRGNGGVLVRSMIVGLIAGVLLGPITIVAISVISSIGEAQTAGDALRSGLRSSISGQYSQILMFAGAVIGLFTGAIAGLTWVIARAGGRSVLAARSLSALASAIPIVLVSLGYHVEGSTFVLLGVTLICVVTVFALSPLVAGRRQREE